ncbi:hypothetical protein BRAO285_1070022 [Bradyrhizobium sp. ORS 285]|nr:hypothetical protein BRAO285_1070022 [Bradyrhizobium sp. ORS 285]
MPLLVNRPDPDDPGGLGAEESGTERTGPTHTNLMPNVGGSPWAETRRDYDSANDPVTLACSRNSRVSLILPSSIMKTAPCG